jgi:polysaccharide biosynthesis transport protein
LAPASRSIGGDVQNENRIELLRPTPQAIDRRRNGALASFDEEIGEAPNLLSYWTVIRKRRWTVLAVLAFVFAGVLIFTLKEMPLYEGKAVIEIEKENPNIVTADDLFGVDNVNSTFLETQYKILQSDSLARSVIRDLSLQHLKEFNPPRHWWSVPSAKLPREPENARPAADTPAPDSDAMYNALKVFRARLDIEPWKQSRLVEVTFDSRDPVRAAEIANALAANYIDQNLQLRWDAAQKASEWLSQQLVGVKAKLEKSEDEMQAYARDNGLLFLESEKGTTENIVDSRLRELQADLTTAQANLYQTESLYRLTQDGDRGALPGVFDDHEIQELTLRLSDLNAQKALMATTFTPDYPKLKQLQNEIDDVQQTLDNERQRGAQNIKDDYEAAVRRVALLQSAFASAQHDANEIAEKSVQYNILKREVDTNRLLYDGLLDRMKQAGVAAGIKDSNIRVVDPAVPPRKPARPRTALNLSLGLMVGLALGVGAAFLEEHLDNSLKTTEDVERIMQLPALALIPSVESLNRNGAHRGRAAIADGAPGLLASEGAATAAEDGNPAGNGHVPKAHWYRIDALSLSYSPLTEAFRGLRTSVLLSAAGQPPRSLLVSSAEPGEGKTTISVNLAISLAQLGQRVLLIDGDLRRPSLHRAFRIRDSLGVVSHLTGQQNWRNAVEKTSLAELDLLVSGPVPPNPAELLSSDRMQKLIQQALEEYKFVVVDSPPLLNVADSRILATLVEGVVLVVKGGHTPRELARRAQAHVSDVGARVIGVVLNNIDLQQQEYSYYRSYSYGAAPQDGNGAN